MATLQDFYEQMTKMSGDDLKKHPGKSCDEAHPDQTHEEWAAGRKEEPGKTAAASLGPVKKTHKNWSPKTEEGSLYKSQLGGAIAQSEDTGQEKKAMDKLAAEEYDAAGRIFARGFYDELEKVARHPFFGAPSAGGVMKAVGRGGLLGGLGLGALAAMASRNPAMASQMGVPSPDVSTSGPDWENVIGTKARVETARQGATDERMLDMRRSQEGARLAGIQQLGMTGSDAWKPAEEGGMSFDDVMKALARGKTPIQTGAVDDPRPGYGIQGEYRAPTPFYQND